MKVFINPFFRGEDKGDGGIRRVVEAQHKYLPKYGIELVDNEAQADVIAIHAGVDVKTIKPIVAHCHGLYWSEYQWENWSHKTNEEVINVMNKAVLVTAPSEWVANSIKRGMAIDAIPVYHGIDADEWIAGENKGYVLWNKTRVDPICDISVIDELADQVPDIQIITTYGTSRRNIQVTGRLPFEEAKELIRNANIYLCSSRETFGIGTLEAMACGVPILGWKWGGQSEFIENGVHGWLATPGDYEELVSGYKYICENREELSKNCIELVRSKFTWDIAAQKYADIYRKAYELENPPIKVSVIIPCYNLGHLVKDAVDSIITQKFSDYEIIIINDASTDDTSDKLEALCNADKRIKIITNEKNLYLAGTLNVGIEAAQGKYIIPVDADNMLGPNALEILSNALDNDPTTHVVYGSMEVIEKDGKRYISGWPQSFDIRKQLNHQNQCPSTSMYRKQIWKRVGGYRTRCRTAEDADFWCRIGSFGGNPKKVTDAVTLIYRNRSESMSHVEADWRWNDWYTWGYKPDLLPYAISIYGFRCEIRTFDPKVISVVIPVGPGHINYLYDAIDSVVAQTYVKWDIIVVNDSGEKLPALYPFVKVLETSTPKSGPAIARNIGINYSKSPLFFLLDADDYLQPTALEDMFQAYIKYGGYIYSDWYEQESAEIKHTPDVVCDDIIRKLPHTISCLYSKLAWKEVGGFDESIDLWEDWDFILALNAAGYCGCRIAKPLLQYRYDGGKRRELAVSTQEDNRLVIINKWKDYINGVKQLGCRGCGGRVVNSPSANSIPVDNRATSIRGNNAILMEFTKDGAGATSFRGKTGQIYRFGSDPSHKIRYVFQEDVQGLLALGSFRVIEEVNDNVLEAKGPPRK